MAKKLVFIENKQDALSFLSSYRNEAGLSDAVLYAFDKDAEAVLIEHDIAYKVPEQVIAFDDYDTVDRDAMRFAGGWHTDSRISGALSYNGIPLGGLIQRDMSFFVSNVLDGIILSRKVIEYEKPEIVYVFKRDLDKAARAVKAGEDETYYGYFSRYFAKNVIELVSPPADPADDSYPRQLFIDDAKNSHKHNARNILWVRDFDYLDVTPELEASLGSKYNLKYLSKSGGTKAYNVKIAGGVVEFDHTCLKDYFRYEGIDFFDVMSYKFDCLKRIVFPRLIALCETVRTVLDEENIDCVMVAEDAILFNKSIVSVAISAGLPSVVLQKGACCHDISFVPVTADKILVWGKAASDYLINSGVRKEKIVIAGSLRFQSHKKADGAKKREILNELGLTRKYGKLFLMTLQHGNRNSFFRNIHITFREELEVIRLLIRTMVHFPEDMLYIKFHPQDEVGDRIFEFIDQDIGENIRTIHHYPIDKLLSITDVLITCFSTTALEALLIDIPVVTVNLAKRRFNIDYAEEKVAAGASSEEELLDALKAVKKENPGRGSTKNKFLAHHFYENNRYASRDLAAFIDDTLLSKRGRG